MLKTLVVLFTNIYAFPEFLRTFFCAGCAIGVFSVKAENSQISILQKRRKKNVVEIQNAIPSTRVDIHYTLYHYLLCIIYRSSTLYMPRAKSANLATDENKENRRRLKSIKL